MCRDVSPSTEDNSGRGNAFRRSTAASCVLGTVLPGKGASELRSPSRGISPRSPMPRPASLWQPLIVAADGDPRPPGGAKQRLLRARRRRVPPRASQRPGNAPQWGGMARTIVEARKGVKEFIPYLNSRELSAFNRTDQPRRISSNKSIRRNITSDDRARGNHRVLSHPDAADNRDTGRDPDVSFNHDGPCDHRVTPS